MHYVYYLIQYLNLSQEILLCLFYSKGNWAFRSLSTWPKSHYQKYQSFRMNIDISKFIAHFLNQYCPRCLQILIFCDLIHLFKHLRSSLRFSIIYQLRFKEHYTYAFNSVLYLMYLVEWSRVMLMCHCVPILGYVFVTQLDFECNNPVTDIYFLFVLENIWHIIGHWINAQQMLIALNWCSNKIIRLWKFRSLYPANFDFNLKEKLSYLLLWYLRLYTIH